MAITIKEIHVKTIIEPRQHRGRADEQRLQQLKREILQDVKWLIKKEAGNKNRR